MPVRPRITPIVAQQLIEHNVLDILEVISLTAEDYAVVIQQLSDHGISGGATYDALILQAAVKADVHRIITLNVDDFQRISPALADRVISPE